jgi:hypothetical protein
MALVKMIRGYYKAPGYGYTNEQGQYVEVPSTGKLTSGDWYLETDMSLAEDSLAARLLSIRGAVEPGEELAEFVGWEERNLDTGD